MLHSDTCPLHCKDEKGENQKQRRDFITVQKENSSLDACMYRLQKKHNTKHRGFFFFRKQSTTFYKL